MLNLTNSLNRISSFLIFWLFFQLGLALFLQIIGLGGNFKSMDGILGTLLVASAVLLAGLTSFKISQRISRRIRQQSQTFMIGVFLIVLMLVLLTAPLPFIYID